MSTSARPRAVAYLRLSREDDASTSIARQRRDLAELAEREGWDVVGELVDDGLTGRKQRDNAVEALRQLRDAEVDVLVVWKFDRWSRQGLRAVADLVETLDARPSALFVAYQDGLRSSSPAWRIIASVLAEVARMESENTSTRIRSSQAHLREVKRFRGMVVPFGYLSVPNPEGPGRVLIPDPVEGPLIAELAERLLAGATLTELTRDLRERRIPTGKSDARKARQLGKPHAKLDPGHWHLSALRTLLRSETILGRTTHVVDNKRVVYTDEHGLPVNFWEPLIDIATSTALRARLGVAPGTVGGRRTRTARLLSDVMFCRCGHKAYVHRTGKAPYYKCSALSRDKGSLCIAPRIMADVAEGFVEGAYLSIAGGWPELVEELIVDRPEDDASLADIENALHELTVALMRDGADGPTILGRIDTLKARRRELTNRPATSRVVLRETGRTYAQAWQGADPETPEGLRKRRDLLLAALDHVELIPQPGNHQSHLLPTEDRLALHWRAPREARVVPA